MKKMFKTSLILLLMSIFMLSSCGGNNSSDSTSTGNGYYQETNLSLNYHDLSLKSGLYRYMPSKGDINILVIPVMIKGYDQYATEANLTRINTAFFGESEETSWQSLSSYYYESSHEALTIKGNVSSWYDSGLDKESLKSHEVPGGDDEGTIYLANQALAWYKQETGNDCTKYDNDKDGYVDGLWLVYNCPTDGSTFWAFTNWNNNPVASISSPSLFCYAWASLFFFEEGYGTSGLDTHTFIHETGHMLGLDDYYNYDSKGGAPMGAIDMMDNNIIDHNAFSKMALGWIKPYVVNGNCSITINRATNYGDAIVLSPSWNSSPFNEYLILELYTPDGLNKIDSDNPYAGNGLRGFTNTGIRLYHVDARLAYKNAYIVSYINGALPGNSNSPSYSLDENCKLINAISKDKRSFLYSNNATANNNSLFYAGDSFTMSNYQNLFYKGKEGKLNDDSVFDFSFKVASIEDNKATIEIAIE